MQRRYQDVNRQNRPYKVQAQPDKPNKRHERRERIRLLRLTVSGGLLVLVVAVKLLMPDVTERYSKKILQLMGENTDFVEAFSAVGRAFSGEGGIMDGLHDAYTSVFGEDDAVEAVAPSNTAAEIFSGVYDDETLPERVQLWQQVLGFAYQSPLQGNIVSSFGYRIHPITGKTQFHYGVDVEADEGKSIRTFADGTVGVVGESSELGNYVTVNHGNGYSTLYAHCKRILVSADQRVRCGDVLGEVGQTGQATGPHLHFEMHYGQCYLNPIYYV